MNLVKRALGGALVLGLLAGPLAASAEPGRLQQLEARVEAMAARLNAMPAGRVGTAAVPADIVGLWTIKGLQNEMYIAGSWGVRSYVWKGTINFFANGNYTQKISGTGNELVGSGAAINSFTIPEEVIRGKWRLAGNQVLLDGDRTNPGDLDAGLSVMTFNSANPDGNTNVLLVATKQPAP